MALAQESPEMVRVDGGKLKLFYPSNPKEKEVSVSSFFMDRYPVTQQEFLEFVKKYPAWSRDQISPLFADKNYLSHWEKPNLLGKKNRPQQPVTNISWFAAKAYCQSQNKRLPTESEWEYAAQASETNPQAWEDVQWRARVLEWYARPAPKIFPNIGEGSPNYWGIYDLHGLVWEWVLDFNSNLLAMDPRESGDANRMRFCGAGALLATEKEDYPTFMRMAFRSSLKAMYTASHLGFRCVRI